MIRRTTQNIIDTIPKRGYRFIGTIRPEAAVIMAVPETQESVELVPVAGGKSLRLVGNGRLA